ncbi:MAG: hypothetical protein TR69_WS6001000930 [candidate division WS6 bacterium OLB20]|uniref:Uncharacterized protein n=1 Tax=candidate division WS6 bacterium OLB20 TaxID=1617426 RepID=A0A136LZ33_9BACT|nr:MAG: hypothetical protein TR69_WS6001000930 [candidate division WS6 bacterium OLB20]
MKKPVLFACVLIATLAVIASTLIIAASQRVLPDSESSTVDDVEMLQDDTGNISAGSRNTYSSPKDLYMKPFSLTYPDGWSVNDSILDERLLTFNLDITRDDYGISITQEGGDAGICDYGYSAANEELTNRIPLKDSVFTEINGTSFVFRIHEPDNHGRRLLCLKHSGEEQFADYLSAIGFISVKYPREYDPQIVDELHSILSSIAIDTSPSTLSFTSGFAQEFTFNYPAAWQVKENFDSEKSTIHIDGGFTTQFTLRRSSIQEWLQCSVAAEHHSTGDVARIRDGEQYIYTHRRNLVKQKLVSEHDVSTLGNGDLYSNWELREGMYYSTCLLNSFTVLAREEDDVYLLLENPVVASSTKESDLSRFEEIFAGLITN